MTKPLPCPESLLMNFVLHNMKQEPAHDIHHVLRVVAVVRRFCEIEGGDPAVAVPAAWLHDVVSFDKNISERATSSRCAAVVACDFLAEYGAHPDVIEAIRHAIVAHSFSSDIEPETIEAKILSDADKIDALGAIGIARCFVVGGRFAKTLFHPEDVTCKDHDPNDAEYILDHFYRKLFRLPNLMHTQTGRAEAQTRLKMMQEFVDCLLAEVTWGKQALADTASVRLYSTIAR